MPRGENVTKYMHGPATQVLHFFNANTVTFKINMGTCPVVTTICSMGKVGIMFNNVT